MIHIHLLNHWIDELVLPHPQLKPRFITISICVPSYFVQNIEFDVFYSTIPLAYHPFPSPFPKLITSKIDPATICFRGLISD